MQQEYIKPLRILKASAGSGKTFRLTVRFLSLLFSENNNYRKIMAVTFTNKATAEMKHRILWVLQLLARGDYEAAKGYVQEIKQQFPELTEEQISEKAYFLYRQILHDYGRLTITTIDKFVQQIIRSFTFELGIDADYRVTMNLRQVTDDLSEMLHLSLNEKPELLNWIIDRAREQINEGNRWNYQGELKTLSKQIFTEDFQRFDDALKDAESDETFEEIQRKIREIKSGFEQELKKQYEKANRILTQFSPPPESLKGRSKNPLFQFTKGFPAFKEYLKKSGTGRFEKLLDNPDEWFGKKAKDANPEFYNELNPVLNQLVAHYQSGIDNYNLATSLNVNLYYLRLIKEMSSLLKEYRAENHLLLISDATHLLEGITRGMEDNPSFIWEKAGNRFRYFLFDEFQDTSRNQWKNFRPLVKNALAEASGKIIEQLIVGDVKQSIYRWRGGDWKILLKEAENELGSVFVDVQSLQVNYRSAGRIIEFNNYIFPFIADWLQQRINQEVSEETDMDFATDFWSPSGYDSIIREAYGDVRQRLPEGKPTEDGIVDWKIFPVDNNQHRFRTLKEDILREISERLFRWIVTEKRYTPGQIGILVRTNTEAQALLTFLKNDLNDRDVPQAYDVISGDALLLKDHISIQLIIETFRLLVSPEKDKRLYQSVCAFLYQSLKQGGQQLKEQDWIKMGKSRLAGMSDYLPEKICQNSGALLQLPLAELLEEIIAQYKLDKNAAALPYLLSLRDCLTQCMEEGNSSPEAFLEWWDIQEDIALTSSENPSAVQIMTIHKAKGLAFDVVVLPFMFWAFSAKANGQVWIDMKQTSFEKIASAPLNYSKNLVQSSVRNQYFEEQIYSYMDALNMLYVALTRPRQHLFLCIPGFSESSKSLMMGLPKSMNAGDVLHTALLNYERENGQPFLFPEPETIKTPSNESQKASAEPSKTFAGYPIAHHLKKQMDTQNTSQIQRLDNDENIRIGLAVHELLSVCHHVERLEPALQKLYQEGWFSAKERKGILTVAHRVLQNKELQALLAQPGIFLNEREIIDKEGKIHRPDKVLVGPEETFIIDFKFTGKESQSHREQVEGYKNLFSEMGYPNVQGWLFYGFQSSLQKV